MKFVQVAWSENEVKILTEMRLKGESYSAIAKVLNRTRNSVIGKGERLKLPVVSNRRGSDQVLKPQKSVRDFAADIIEQWQPGECRWISGDFDDFTATGCKNKTLEGGHFCLEHDKIAYPKKYGLPYNNV